MQEILCWGEKRKTHKREELKRKYNMLSGVTEATSVVCGENYKST